MPTTSAAYRKSPAEKRNISVNSACRLCQGNLWRLISIGPNIVAIRCECTRSKPVAALRDYKMRRRGRCRVKTLRSRVAELMVRIHCIPPELADYHVRAMEPGEVKSRFLFYVRAGLSKPGAKRMAAPMERNPFAERSRAE